MTAKRLLFILLFVSIYPFSFSQENNVASYYVPAVNGTKLAVDVYFPEKYKNQKLPVLFEFTRYWRGKEDAKTGKRIAALSKRDKYFLDHDYILAKVDVRGTGASYGVRLGEYTPTEVKDAWYLVDWMVNQPWSDGKVGAYGTSYSGTTAELLCATQHPAIKAVIPGWSDFDVYESPSRPYGMLATSFIAPWSQYVDWLDQNSVEHLGVSVRRVEEAIPTEAIKAHKNNPNVLEALTASPFKDSKFGDFKFEELDPLHWKKEISESNIPMLVLTSWLDAGTAEGTLLRLQHFTNPQKVVMMPTSHGGRSHASPFVVSDSIVAPVPSVAEQLILQRNFFDHYIKGENKNVEDWPTIKYYNFGEESFKQSDVWPPKGQERITYYLDANGKLNASASEAPQGMDAYLVDFSVSTGTNNRWTTQMGKHILNLNNRNAADSLMLTYTTAPLEEPLQITGVPVISLSLSSTHKEGAIFVYLEDVDPSGKSRYITEGGLLLQHRKLSKNVMFNTIPYHSFKKLDASPMPTDTIEEISFKLHPTSILIKKGHSIRIAISGADKDTFDKVPKEGIPTLNIYRNKTNKSFLELPIVK
ncbi:CocE/NonD family hydrolase [Lacinutrix sp. C3R15]|uniref:CocE/NonD family hydrolase n=1 Tax=Flavobacteriaceae TaxID=49546 RepID=UPI001C09E987|nr:MULTISPECIES: CocE/NonD family hydrolase [Flavobacteriaceae]MBU2940211.1 CocE/NonD family hydrolase [Lacinutrix sp. C3R15]MDO6623528.1 CocE/NonD family hydrolase [Oceanihabitans sp. 1_MG-2023]